MVPEDRRSAVIIPLYKGKGERGLNVAVIEVLISLLSVVGKIYVGNLVDKSL